jgi:hypothetical protein
MGELMGELEEDFYMCFCFFCFTSSMPSETIEGAMAVFAGLFLLL